MLSISDFERCYRGHVPQGQELPRRFAVLVPLVERDGVPQLLFEVRAATLHRQPGEVCFPGGQAEPGESDEACALRETEEELGIPPSAIRVVARLDYLVQQGSFFMQPILGVVDAGAVEHMRPNPDEVGETFLVPVEFFRTHPPEVYTYDMIPQVPADFPYERIGFPEGYRWRKGRGSVPVYQWQGRAIWGLTGRIVRRLMEGLGPL